MCGFGFAHLQWFVAFRISVLLLSPVYRVSSGFISHQLPHCLWKSKWSGKPLHRSPALTYFRRRKLSRLGHWWPHLRRAQTLVSEMLLCRPARTEGGGGKDKGPKAQGKRRHCKVEKKRTNPLKVPWTLGLSVAWLGEKGVENRFYLQGV